jgi:hypothetical protein
MWACEGQRDLVCQVAWSKITRLNLDLWEIGEYIEVVEWVILQHFGLGIARDHYAPVETHKKQSG